MEYTIIAFPKVYLNFDLNTDIIEKYLHSIMPLDNDSEKFIKEHPLECEKICYVENGIYYLCFTGKTFNYKYLYIKLGKYEIPFDIIYIHYMENATLVDILKKGQKISIDYIRFSQEDFGVDLKDFSKRINYNKSLIETMVEHNMKEIKILRKEENKLNYENSLSPVPNYYEKYNNIQSLYLQKCYFFLFKDKVIFNPYLSDDNDLLYDLEESEIAPLFKDKELQLFEWYYSPANIQKFVDIKPYLRPHIKYSFINNFNMKMLEKY